MRTSLFAIATTVAALMASTTTAVHLDADVEAMDNLEFNDDYSFAEIELEEGGKPSGAAVDKAIKQGTAATKESLQKMGRGCDGAPTFKDRMAAYASHGNTNITAEVIQKRRCDAFKALSVSTAEKSKWETTPCMGRPHKVDVDAMNADIEKAKARGETPTVGILKHSDRVAYDFDVTLYYEKRCG